MFALLVKEGLVSIQSYNEVSFALRFLLALHGMTRNSACEFYMGSSRFASKACREFRHSAALKSNLE